MQKPCNQHIKKAYMKTNTTTKNCQSELNQLNRLYSKFIKAQESLFEAYSKAYAEVDDMLLAKRKCARLASAKFELLRKRLPKTKFDIATGKYFLAEQDGKEVFHIKITRSEEAFLEVTASCEKEALAIAAKKSAEKKVVFGEAATKVENISRN